MLAREITVKGRIFTTDQLNLDNSQVVESVTIRSSVIGGSKKRKYASLGADKSRPG